MHSFDRFQHSVSHQQTGFLEDVLVNCQMFRGKRTLLLDFHHSSTQKSGYLFLIIKIMILTILTVTMIINHIALWCAIYFGVFSCPVKIYRSFSFKRDHICNFLGIHTKTHAMPVHVLMAVLEALECV